MEHSGSGEKLIELRFSLIIGRKEVRKLIKVFELIHLANISLGIYYVTDPSLGTGKTLMDKS